MPTFRADDRGELVVESIHLARIELATFSVLG